MTLRLDRLGVLLFVVSSLFCDGAGGKRRGFANTVAVLITAFAGCRDVKGSIQIRSIILSEINEKERCIEEGT